MDHILHLEPPLWDFHCGWGMLAFKTSKTQGAYETCCCFYGAEWQACTTLACGAYWSESDSALGRANEMFVFGQPRLKARNYSEHYRLRHAGLEVWQEVRWCWNDCWKETRAASAANELSEMKPECTSPMPLAKLQHNQRGFAGERSNSHYIGQARGVLKHFLWFHNKFLQLKMTRKQSVRTNFQINRD